MIFIGFSNGSCHSWRQQILCFFKIHVYEIIIDLTGTSSHHTYHGDEKSGSTVLFILHFIGVDYELSALFEKHRNIESSVRTGPYFSLFL